MSKPKDATQDRSGTPLKAVKDAYADMYNTAKHSGKLTRLTYRIHTWSEESPLVIGKIIGVTLFEDGRFDQAVNAYRIRTNEGIISCILGRYTDAQLVKVDLIDKIIAITYLGKKELPDDRKVNLFDIDILNDPGGE